MNNIQVDNLVTIIDPDKLSKYDNELYKCYSSRGFPLKVNSISENYCELMTLGTFRQTFNCEISNLTVIENVSEKIYSIDNYGNLTEEIIIYKGDRSTKTTQKNLFILESFSYIQEYNPQNKESFFVGELSNNRYFVSKEKALEEQKLIKEKLKTDILADIEKYKNQIDDLEKTIVELHTKYNRLI